MRDTDIKALIGRLRDQAQSYDDRAGMLEREAADALEALAAETGRLTIRTEKAEAARTVEYAVLDFAVSAPDFVERLNQKAAEGWRLVTATRSEKRVLLFMERHTLIEKVSDA